MRGKTPPKIMRKKSPQKIVREKLRVYNCVRKIQNPLSNCERAKSKKEVKGQNFEREKSKIQKNCERLQKQPNPEIRRLAIATRDLGTASLKNRNMK